ILREIPQILDRTLTRKFRKVSCRDFRSRGDRAANYVFKEARRRQNDFDRADAKARRIARCGRIGRKRYQRVATAKTIARPAKRERRRTASNWASDWDDNTRRVRRKSRRPEAIRTKRVDDDRKRPAISSDERAGISAEGRPQRSARSNERGVRGQDTSGDFAPDFATLGLLLALFSGAAWVVFRISRRPTEVDDDDEGGADWQERAFESIRAGAVAETPPARGARKASSPAPERGAAVVFGRRTSS
ncbi:MAG: hypothetical protein ACR2O4_01490, partial [Hyphomicrobiaceae bacterium]